MSRNTLAKIQISEKLKHIAFQGGWLKLGLFKTKSILWSKEKCHRCLALMEGMAYQLQAEVPGALCPSPLSWNTATDTQTSPGWPADGSETTWRTARWSKLRPSLVAQRKLIPKCERAPCGSTETLSWSQAHGWAHPRPGKAPSWPRGSWAIITDHCEQANGSGTPELEEDGMGYSWPPPTNRRKDSGPAQQRESQGRLLPHLNWTTRREPGSTDKGAHQSRVRYT